MKRFLVFLIAIAAVGFATVMVLGSYSPQAAWRRIVDYFEKQIPSPQSLPTPTPTPTPAPFPEATPTIVPAPAATATPIATATPPDPVTWLVEHKECWPKETVLLDPVDFPVVLSGKVVGSAKVPAGMKVKVYEIDAEKIAVRYNGGGAVVPINATNLRTLAKWEMEKTKPTPTASPAVTVETAAPSPFSGFGTQAGAVGKLPRNRMDGRGFQHPGVMFSKADLDRMKANVNVDPWKSGFAVFESGYTASIAYKMRGPFEEVGGKPDRHRLEYISDMTAIKDQAIMWYVTGREAYAKNAMEILEAWAKTHKKWSGETWGGLLRGDFGLAAIIGAEILRASYPGWNSGMDGCVRDYVDRMISLKNGVKCENPATDEIGTGNQGAAQLKALMAAAIYLDDQKQFDYVVAAVRENACASLKRNSLPTGQNAESGRDQGHPLGGIGGFMAIAELASKQGLDMYGDLENRLLKEMEYWSKYNLGHNVPYSPFGPCRNLWNSISDKGRFLQYPVSYLESVDNIYVLGKGLSSPYCAQLRALYPPDASTFTTNWHAIPTRPESPTQLRTATGDGVVALSWFPSLGSTSYTVKRATNNAGPFTVLATGRASPFYLDKNLKNGTTYFYVVCGNGTGGEGPNSNPVSASPEVPELIDVNLGGDAPDKTVANGPHLTMKGWGHDIRKDGDFAHFAYRALSGDGMITAKLQAGSPTKVGIMMRGDTGPNASQVSIVLQGNGVQLMYRSRGSFFSFSGEDNPRAKWLRLQHIGYAFNAAYSSDGVTWKPLGSSIVSDTGDTLHVGLFAAGDKTVLFENVTISQGKGSAVSP